MLAEVLKHEPNLQITYFSDAGFTPYGTLSAVELTQRLQKIFHWLESKGCDGIVVACNAASAALLQTSSEVLQKADLRVQYKNNFHAPIYDVITPAIRFLRVSSFQRIGVIGGDATVQSHIYRDSLSKLDVTEQSAQPLSGLIEAGMLSDEDVLPMLRRIFAKYDINQFDALVLACTHYPAVENHITRLFPKWTLVDPAVIVSNELHLKLAPAQSPSQKYYTTGSAEQTISSAAKAFGFTIPEVELLPINLDLNQELF